MTFLSKNKKTMATKNDCTFCKSDITPSYKDFDSLARFINDRAKIASRSRTGICAKHQRRLSQAVKRARHLALLPFSGRV